MKGSPGKKRERDEITLLLPEGLRLSIDFVSTEEEKALLEGVNARVWDTSLRRRTQHYGYLHDYSNPDAIKKVDPLPAWCEVVIDRLLAQKLLLVRPDQMIVNEYVPGQGIAPHVDNTRLFEDGIVSLSLGSDIVMDFRKGLEHRQLLLACRSVIVMHGAARFLWSHGIAARRADGKVKRGKRVSLTFRKMKP